VHYFNYVNGQLHCEGVPVDRLAQEHGTPLYIYSAQTIQDHYKKLTTAFAPANPLICYSTKANSNLSVLNYMKEMGSGFDVVSGGELERVLKIGGDPKKVVFAGVGKTDEEIAFALEQEILLFNVESEEELENINRIAGERKKTAHCALRINPDVDPQTHKYITTGKKENKFGVDLIEAKRILGRHAEFSHVKLNGLHVHIGSQITKVEPYVETLQRVADFLPECKNVGCPVEWLDIGGGFGIWYKDKLAKSADTIAEPLLPLIKEMGIKLILEPGRFIVGNAGIMVSRVLYIKESGGKNFVICDAGMNDLLRPSLYGAYHRIWPVATEPGVQGEVPNEDTWEGPHIPTDLVGPICESGDIFAKDRKMPPMKRGDLVAIYSTGAYGFVMSSTYNSHPRPCEVMVAGEEAKVVTKREKFEDLIRNESIVPFSLS
jgi:diaminopimelate decarboxylase